MFCGEKNFLEKSLHISKCFGGGGKTVIFDSDADIFPLLGTPREDHTVKICTIVKRHVADLNGHAAYGDLVPCPLWRIQDQRALVGGIKDPVNVTVGRILQTHRYVNQIFSVGKGEISDQPDRCRDLDRRRG